MKKIALTAALALPIPLFAQEPAERLDDMVISGEASPHEAFFDRPFSATVFPRTKLDRRDITAVQDVADAVPNLNVMDAGMRSFNGVVGIRGLVNTPFFSGPSTVIYVDDAPYGNAFTYANRLFDIDSIEAYRGPQGALFGQNSYAGVLNVRSRQPTNDLTGAFSVAGGNFDRWAVDGYVSGALIQDRLFYSLGSAYLRRNGFLHNVFLGTRPDGVNAISGRASMTWKPSERWDIRLATNLDNFDDGVPRLMPLNDVTFEIASNLEGENKQRINSQSLRIAYQGDAHEAIAVIARRDWKLDPLLVDTDFTPAPIVSFLFRENEEQWSYELPLQPNAPTGNWDWSAGFFASNSKFDGLRRLTVLGVDDPIDWSIDEDGYALFGQMSYSGVDPFRLHAGLRFDYVQKRFERIRQDPFVPVAPILARKEYFFVSPKVAVDYALSDRALIYANTGLAFKPGGFSGGSDLPALAEFESEYMWANELGVKWSSDRVEASLALFYYRIRNYQVERFFTPVDFVVLNAPKTNSYGGEVELDVRLWQGLRAEAAFGYTRIEFEEFRDPFTGIDLAGNQAPYTPEFNLMLATQYEHPAGYFGRAELVWTGDTYFDDLNTEVLHEGGYAVFNARIGFRRDGFNLYVSRPGRLYTRLLKSSGCFWCHCFSASMGVQWFRARCGMEPL